MHTARQLIYRWWPTATVVAVILYATLNSDPVGDIGLSLVPHLDKLIHAIMFGGLFSAIIFDWRRAGKPLPTSVLLFVATIAVAAGGMDEMAQEAIHNGREGDILDFAADCIGIAVAFFSAPPLIKRIFS